MGNMRTGTETVNSCINYLVNSKVVNLNCSDYDDNGADSNYIKVQFHSDDEKGFKIRF